MVTLVDAERQVSAAADSRSGAEAIGSRLHTLVRPGAGQGFGSSATASARLGPDRCLFPQMPLGRKHQALCVLIDRTDDLLDRLDCGLFKIRFTALGAHPGGDGIED